jgi:SagB-type dehydrogenase family enzyme
MPKRYVVSEFVSVSWRDGDLQIASPVTATTLTTSDASLLVLLSAFAVPRTLEEVARENDAAVIGEWIAAGILVDAGALELAAVLHHWDPQSLALHVSSRDPAFRKRSGHDTLAVAPRRSADTIPLAPYSAPSRGAGDLAALLDARRSRRIWANTAIGMQTFSDLFWLAARNRADARGRVSRPYPSGGAAYSLELYPVLADHAVGTLASGVYRYLPEAHALETVSRSDADVQPFLQAARMAMAAAPPPVVIVITSRYARQSEEYGPIAYTLVLKEVGCLFQTLYLAAESLGLAACALGCGMPRALLAGLCDTWELEEPVVGEFALGAAS